MAALLADHFAQRGSAIPQPSPQPRKAAEEYSKDELDVICRENGITVPRRTRKAAQIALMTAYFDAVQAEEPVTGDSSSAGGPDVKAASENASPARSSAPAVGASAAGMTVDKVAELAALLQREQMLAQLEGSLRAQQVAAGDAQWQALLEGKRKFLADARSHVRKSAAGPVPPDESSLHAALLLPAMLLLELPTTAQQMEAYLLDTADQRIPVERGNYLRVIQQYPNLVDKLLCVDSPGTLAINMTAALLQQYDFGSTELHTPFSVYRPLRAVFEGLNDFSRLQMDCKIHLIKAATGFSSRALQGQARPGITVEVELCTVFLGEHRMAGALQAAEKDLVDKFTYLNPTFYGPVETLLAYTASGSLMQLHLLYSDTSGVTKLDAVSPVFDLTKMDHRADLLLVMAKAYCVLHLTSSLLPDAKARLPLVRAMPTEHEGTWITLERTPGMPLHLDKTIKRFSAFATEHGTSLEELEQAYAAAGVAFQRAQQQQQPPWMVAAVVGGEPSFRPSPWDDYSVLTTPIGYRAVPCSERDLRALALACCKTADTLHSAGLVHRDLRLANVVRLPGGSWVVINLEQAALADKPVAPSQRLRGWGPDTLDPDPAGGHDVYSRWSDMHCIGVMLEDASRGIAGLSDTARHFMAQLQQKALDAKQALSHAFLI